MRTLIVVGTPPQRTVLKYLLPAARVALPAEPFVAGEQFDLIVVTPVAHAACVADLAPLLAIGGELHRIESLPDIVAEIMAREAGYVAG